MHRWNWCTGSFVNLKSIWNRFTALLIFLKVKILQTIDLSKSPSSSEESFVVDVESHSTNGSIDEDIASNHGLQYDNDFGSSYGFKPDENVRWN